MTNKEKMTASVIMDYQKRRSMLKTIGEFKELGIELRDRFGLKEMEAIDFLNNRNVLEILERYS